MLEDRAGREPRFPLSSGDGVYQTADRASVGVGKLVEGEHRTWSLGDDGWYLDQIRPPGFFGSNEGDHLHSEQGGAEGAVVHLSMTAVDGVIWEVLDDAGEVVSTTTLADFKRVLERQGSVPAQPGS